MAHQNDVAGTTEELRRLAEANITRAKELRVELDSTLQKLKYYRNDLMRWGLQSADAARHASISVTAVEDAIMRLGMVLKEY